MVLLLLIFTCCTLVKENDFEIDFRNILHNPFLIIKKTPTFITQLFIAELTNSCCQDDNSHKNKSRHQSAYNNYLFAACLVKDSFMTILRSKWIFIQLCRKHITTNYMKQSSMKKKSQQSKVIKLWSKLRIFLHDFWHIKEISLSFFSGWW